MIARRFVILMVKLLILLMVIARTLVTLGTYVILCGGWVDGWMDGENQHGERSWRCVARNLIYLYHSLFILGTVVAV